MKYWTAEESNQFLTANSEDRFYALYVLALTTGLRQGELFGLKWEDIDFTEHTLAVRRIICEIGGRLSVGEPKTAGSRRRVDLPKTVLEVLRRHRQNIFDEGLSSEWIFCDTKGGAVRKSNFRENSFLRAVERAKVPMIRFHDMRHTAATILLSQGIHPKVVQERLGHAQIGITLDTYSHVLPSMQKEAAAKLESVFSLGLQFGCTDPIVPILASHEKSRKPASDLDLNLVGPVGLEPTTAGLRVLMPELLQMSI
ncbi:MAG: site-specific integrase [Myxococcaceae bacterium]